VRSTNAGKSHPRLQLLKMPRNVIDLTQPSSPPSSDHESIDLSELEDAIMAAEPEDLQLTLIAICSSFPQAAKIAAARLMIESDDQSDDQSEGESSKESESSAVVSNGRERKRVRPRYVRSQNCEEDFDAANATTEVCRWHEGSSINYRGDHRKYTNDIERIIGSER